MKKVIALLLINIVFTSCNNGYNVKEAVANDNLQSQAIRQGTWLSPRVSPYIDVYYNPSVSTYGFTTAFDHANNSWNGISSKIVIRKASLYKDGVNSIQVVDAYNPIYADIWGVAIGYKFDADKNKIEASRDESWVDSKITIYNKKFEPLKPYPEAFSRKQRQIAVHETGHSIKLAHTNEEYANETTQPSIMYSDAVPGVIAPAPDDVPQVFDKGELKQKWGQ